MQLIISAVGAPITHFEENPKNEESECRSVGQLLVRFQGETSGTGEQGPLFTPSWTRDSVDCTRIGTLGETNAPFRTVTRTSIAIGLVITVGFLPSALMFS